jgi:hypothetical protein
MGEPQARIPCLAAATGRNPGRIPEPAQAAQELTDFHNASPRFPHRAALNYR